MVGSAPHNQPGACTSRHRNEAHSTARRFSSMSVAAPQPEDSLLSSLHNAGKSPSLTEGLDQPPLSVQSPLGVWCYPLLHGGKIWLSKSITSSGACAGVFRADDASQGQPSALPLPEMMMSHQCVPLLDWREHPVQQESCCPGYTLSLAGLGTDLIVLVPVPVASTSLSV